MIKPIIHLDHISEDDLLKKRISDLPLKLEGTWIESCIQELYRELEAKSIIFKPTCYLADEWLTPQKETCIGIPFYLTHPTLIRLEKKIMSEAEGEGKAWCMKLLRHEAGHAIYYAYKLYKKKRWQKIFGPSSKHYDDTFKYRPYSKSFVRHLDGYYAQYHPEEDFVETFAVWLTPGLDWEEQYKGWKALEKLKYVDCLMKGITNKEPSVNSNQKYWRLSTLRYSLQTYYKRKRSFSAEEFPDFHDRFLKKVFKESEGTLKSYLRATDVIKKYKKGILNSVAKHSGEKKYIIADLIKGLQTRSKELNLVTQEEETSVALQISTYVTSLIMNYQYTGRFRGDQNARK